MGETGGGIEWVGWGSRCVLPAIRLFLKILSATSLVLMHFLSKFLHCPDSGYNLNSTE